MSESSSKRDALNRKLTPIFFAYFRQMSFQDKFSEVPIMMVTTESEMSQMTRAIEAGATEYLMKPFTKEMIAEKLEILGLTS